MSIDAMKQALAVLAFYYGQHGYELDAKVIIALRTAIKHAERPQTHSDDCWRWHHQCAVTKIERMQTQKPVAWMYVNEEGECDQIDHIEKEPMPDDPSVTPLYTAPRQWQGLTDKEIDALMPVTDGSAETNAIPVEVSTGIWGKEYDEVDAWSRPLVIKLIRAIEAKLRERNT